MSAGFDDVFAVVDEQNPAESVELRGPGDWFLDSVTETAVSPAGQVLVVSQPLDVGPVELRRDLVSGSVFVCETTCSGVVFALFRI